MVELSRQERPDSLLPQLVLDLSSSEKFIEKGFLGIPTRLASYEDE